MVTGEDDSVPGSLQPWELRPDVNVLSRVTDYLKANNLIWDRWQFPLDPFWIDGVPRLWRGLGNQQFLSVLQPVTFFVDGDRESFLSVTNFGGGGNKTLSEFYTIDPGAPLPLERFEIHLPSEFLANGDANPLCYDALGQPWSHYVSHQGELTGSFQETAAILTESVGQRIHTTQYRPLEVRLGSIEQHLVAPIVIEFPHQFLRFVRWRTFPDGVNPNNVPTNFALAYSEFELYGRGFSAETRYLSKIQDLGEPSTLGRVFLGVSKWRREGSRWIETTDGEGNVQREWEIGDLVEAPEADVAVTFRLKNGTTSDPFTYFTWSDQGELFDITRSEWDGMNERLTDAAPEFVGWRGPVTPDRDNWTAWSGPVNQSGTRLDMPSRQFFQLEVKMTTTSATEMARLDSLWIEFFPLLVPTLIGEIGLPNDPLEPLARVPIGEPTEFVYAISADFGNQRRDGFDALRIETPAEHEFLYLRRGSDRDEVDLGPDDVESEAEQLTLFLPEPIRADEKLWVGLKATVYTVTAQLRSEVFNRADSELRQAVEEGDVTEEIGTNQLRVVAEGDVVEKVMGELTLLPRTLTPNGDGSNETMEINYTLFGVLDAAVEITFYSLAGEAVHRIQASTGQAASTPRSGTAATPRVIC